VTKDLSAGEDVNEKDENGGTPLQVATYEGHKETVELLIANGADVNAKETFGGTPLHSAAYVGLKEIAKLLLAKGADVNAKDFKGDTPLDWAIALVDRQPGRFQEWSRRRRFLVNNAFKRAEIADLLRKHGGKTGEELKAERK
jgi:hypothetical protein